MRRKSVWKKLLGLHRAVVEGVEVEGDGTVVVSVGPTARERDRCPRCRRRCPGYDWGEGRRRWRALALFAGLEWIGIDEISIRKGQRYLTVLVDHDTGRLVWAAAGRDKQTVGRFLDLLGAERCKQLSLVSCDMASWITIPLAERCRTQTVCYDPFHLVKLATDARDDIRREVCNEARRAGQKQLAAALKGARFALWKNPGNLTERQQLKLARIQQRNQRLYRAYLLCQHPRQIYRVGYEEAIVLLDAWLRWARRCRLEPFVKLARTITEQRPGIEAAIQHGLSNARVEQVNTQLRLIVRRAFGFHSYQAAISSRCSPSQASARHSRAGDATHGSYRRPPLTISVTEPCGRTSALYDELPASRRLRCPQTSRTVLTDARPRSDQRTVTDAGCTPRLRGRRRGGRARTGSWPKPGDRPRLRSRRNPVGQAGLDRPRASPGCQSCAPARGPSRAGHCPGSSARPSPPTS